MCVYVWDVCVCVCGGWFYKVVHELYVNVCANFHKGEGRGGDAWMLMVLFMCLCVTEEYYWMNDIG